MYEIHRHTRSHHVELGAVVVEEKPLPAAPILEEAGLLPAVTPRSAVADDDGRSDDEVGDPAFRDTPFGLTLRPRILGRIARGLSVQALSNPARYIS